ncbi:MAG: flagellar M-ring protein FliF [Nitrospirae bacterium]|nr:flagellar M-ring protein FliF [Nitrospirota bacterium]
MANIIDAVKSWPAGKQIALVISLVLSVAGMVLLFSWSQKPDYAVLYTNLAESDAGMVVQKLKDMKVPYTVESGAVMVPSDKVYDLRFQLAAQGLPRGGGVGFELFDKTNFSTTDFVQRLNYRRAMQGEVERTIMSLSEVERCRVHLAIPEKTLFSRDGERPTASVLVKLMPGRALSQSQVHGIVHLVSSSVEGLNARDVTVIDNRGEMLTQPVNDSMGLTSSQLEYQRSYEKDIEARVLGILEPVVGKGKVKAKAAVDVDFTRIEKTEEKFDPDAQVVRSEQKNLEKSTSPQRGGIPGVTSNLPGKPNTTTAAISQGQSEKKSETINYEISKITSHVISPSAAIKKVTVAVLVDGIYTLEKGAKEQKYMPRTAEDIKYYDELVKNAIGFTTDRGDEVKVVNMPFKATMEDGAMASQEKKKEYLPVILSFARYAVPLIIGIVFIIIVVKPLVKALTTVTPPAPAPAAAAGPQMMSSPAAIEKIPEIEKKEGSLKGGLIEWAKKNPREASELVRGWMTEE